MRILVIGEGASDRMLEHPLRWILLENNTSFEIIEPDYSLLKSNGPAVSERLSQGISHYSPDLTIIHRDADSTDPSERQIECTSASDEFQGSLVVSCIPVRMSEAWFLFDESALRIAAGNPSGNNSLSLPSVRSAERMANPKRALESALIQASGTTGRRRNKFVARLGQRKQRLASLIKDYSDLQSSNSFSDFRNAIERAIG